MSSVSNILPLSIDWGAFPGPRHYAPGEVEAALAALREVRDERSGTAAYNRVLFAVGNNHAGTLYPAAIAAAQEVLGIALSSDGMARATAFEILTDMVLFEPEPGFESYRRPNGSIGDVKAELVSRIRQSEHALVQVVTDAEEDGPNRVNAFSILWDVTADLRRLRELARRLLGERIPEDLERECEALLEQVTE